MKEPIIERTLITGKKSIIGNKKFLKILTFLSDIYVFYFLLICYYGCVSLDAGNAHEIISLLFIKC